MNVVRPHPLRDAADDMIRRLTDLRDSGALDGVAFDHDEAGMRQLYAAGRIFASITQRGWSQIVAEAGLEPDDYESPTRIYADFLGDDINRKADGLEQDERDRATPFNPWREWTLSGRQMGVTR